MRDITESWLLIDHDTNGDHAQVTLPERASDPGAVANKGFAYTKDVSTATELFYRDAAGNVVQITAAGGLNTFPSGTKMLFVQTAAPTGWTKDVDQNDKALRVVSGTPGTGGATAFSSVFGAGKTAGATTLTTGQIPDLGGFTLRNWETVDIVKAVHGVTTVTNDGTSGTRGSQEGGTVADRRVDINPSGGASHNHTLSLDLQFMDVIKATKD